jgi:hypothetical protein
MRFTGQILRVVGLLIEMIGILAYAMWNRRDGGGVPARVSDSLTARQIWTVVGVGFVIWLIGNIVTYWPQSSHTGPKSSREHDGNPKL